MLTLAMHADMFDVKDGLARTLRWMFDFDTGVYNSCPVSSRENIGLL